MEIILVLLLEEDNLFNLVSISVIRCLKEGRVFLTESYVDSYIQIIQCSVTGGS